MNNKDNKNRFAVTDGGKNESTERQPDKNKESKVNPEEKEIQNVLFDARCQCGRRLLVIEPTGWKVNIIGILQFRCPGCGRTTSTSPIWL